MPCFPMFVDLKGKRILVLGGGKVALRKVKKLQPFGGKINVVAPRVEPELEAIPGLEISRHPFRLSDLWPRPELVIAATDDRQVNARAARLCRRHRIPVNVADDGSACRRRSLPCLRQRQQLSVSGSGQPGGFLHGNLYRRRQPYGGGVFQRTV